MEDLIACLYPYPPRAFHATEAVESRENTALHIEAQRKVPELPSRGSRESTASPGNSEETTPEWHGEPGLQLTFSHGLKAGLGFVIGTEASSCDIVVPAPEDNKISRQHCYITFDAQRRLIVRDCSTHGTIVKYNGAGGDKRRNFTWIISGHRVLDEIKEIVLQIHKNLEFQIVVSKPTYPDLFFQNVDQFREEVADNDELPFGALGLQSAIVTAAASGTQTPQKCEATDTPNENSILLRRKKLGEGTFSVVYHVWDVSAGSEYASKKVRRPENVDWRKEASIMRQTSHEHITRLIATIEKPSPRLILEYLPLGNLEYQHRQRSISNDEVLTILHQSLLALTYLHGQRPPVAHRDIKPQNILVQSRDTLHIKLADFGLSKASDYLSTVCGSPIYVAPEIAQYYESNSPQGFKYVNAVDIWSLGVVIFKYAYGLPQTGTSNRLPWCEEIINELSDWASDDLIDILSNMLVMDPKLRDPAKKCLHRASQLLVPGRSLTPTPAACSLQHGRSEDDDGSTTIILGNLWGTQGTSYHDNSEDHSSHPVRTKRHRSPGVGSTNTSSSRGRTKRRRPDTHHSNDDSERYGESDRFGELYNAILKLFEDLKVDASQDLDDRTYTLVEELCENFRRLDITRVRLTQNDILGQATVSAGIEGEEVVLATLTPSELKWPPAELAAHLLNMLQSQSSQRRSRLMALVDDTTIHTDFKAQQLENPSSWTADSIGSQITDSNVQQLGVTYPSALLDVCNVSGIKPCSEIS